MSSFSSIIKSPNNIDYDGKDNDEQILFVLRRSTLTNIPWVLSVILFALLPFIADPMLRSLQVNGKPVISLSLLSMGTLFWYLFTFGYFFSSYINWYFNVLIISTKKIVDMDFIGLTYKNISETTITNIEDVTSNITGTFGTIFNIGSLYIQTAAEQREFEFTQVDDPSKLRDTIADLVADIKKNGHNHNN